MHNKRVKEDQLAFRFQMLRFFSLILLLCAFNFDEAIDEIASSLPEQHVFVSKVEPKNTQDQSWSCDCYNSTDGGEIVIECRCQGKEFKHVPLNLNENLFRITIIDSNLKILKRNSFQPYRSTLRDM